MDSERDLVPRRTLVDRKWGTALWVCRRLVRPGKSPSSTTDALGDLRQCVGRKFLVEKKTKAVTVVD